MTIPRTNGGKPTIGKQIVPRDSLSEQKRRCDTLQADFLRIVGAMGMSRSLLQRRDNWDNASRDPNSYEPFRPYNSLQTMIRDVVRTVADRGNEAEHKAVRKAVVQFYETSMRDALEFLGVESEDCVIALTLESKRETAEADCATTIALTSKTPENFQRAARENTEALTVMERLRDALHCGARTPRFQVIR